LSAVAFQHRINKGLSPTTTPHRMADVVGSQASARLLKWNGEGPILSNKRNLKSHAITFFSVFVIPNENGRTAI
ncbi:hypothetical protein CEXT_737121, partial [Caerostris extrusa]